ncbi:MAG: regulatory protein RecX [Clostridia bacterium]|nr:regulatory protein RecX [Clostridia bacterium]
MRITKIEPQKKHKNRMSVFLDGEFAFGIDAFSLYALKLKENDEINEEKLSFIKETTLYESAKTYAANLVSARSYTERGIYDKLLSYTQDRDITEKTVSFLKKYKLIDDTDYAKRFFTDGLNIKKYGVRKIKYKLLEKGISKEIIEKVVIEAEDHEKEKDNLLALAKKKLGGDFEYKNLMRTKRYLASRGYSFEDIDDVITKLKNSSDLSSDEIF